VFRTSPVQYVRIVERRSMASCPGMLTVAAAAAGRRGDVTARIS